MLANAQKALDYAFTTWDSDGDLVLDSQQHNTYDVEFYGENSLVNSMFFAGAEALQVGRVARGRYDGVRRNRGTKPSAATTTSGRWSAGESCSP